MIQTPIPHHTMLIKPAGRVLEVLGGGQTHRANAPFLPGTDKPGLLKHLEMLHKRGQRHVKGFGQVADRGGPVPEALDHAAARWIRQGVKGHVERLRNVHDGNVVGGNGKVND